MEVEQAASPDELEDFDDDTFEILNAHIMGESCPQIDRIENCSKKVFFLCICVLLYMNFSLCRC